MPYTDTGQTWQKLALISGHAQRDSKFQFTSLAHLLDEEYLRDCYKSLNRNKAVGVDNVSWEEYGKNLDEKLKLLVSRLKGKKYKPKPMRRVYIPKNETEKRALGISALESKIVERGITCILESIYEQDFLNSSYGFRPNRNAHQALKELNDLIMFQPISHIIEADIERFFDNVSHEKLIEFIQIRIKDTTLINLIKKFLKAGYIVEGLLVKSEKGTAQGSILSPILANIFLHYVLDEWFDKVVKSNVRVYCKIVRYCDDFVCVCRYVEDASRIERALKNRCQNQELRIAFTLNNEK